MKNELQDKIDIINEFVNIQTQPGNFDQSEYMRGFANGLILAQSTLRNVEPNYILAADELPAPALVKLTEMSGDHFSQIFIGGFAPALIKKIVSSFESLHGFHIAIAHWGNFESHRIAVSLGY